MVIFPVLYSISFLLIYLIHISLYLWIPYPCFDLPPSLSSLLSTSLFSIGIPDSSAGKESACSAGEPGSIPGSGRSAREGIDDPPQYSWASLLARWYRLYLQYERPGFNPWGRKIPWRREWLPSSTFWVISGNIPENAMDRGAWLATVHGVA